MKLRVDGKYTFTTKRRNDRRSTFLETFVVGNTHRLAYVEASVYHRSEHGEELLLGSCVVSIKRLSRGVEKVREHVLVGVSRETCCSFKDKAIDETLMLSSQGSGDNGEDGQAVLAASSSVACLSATTPWGASESSRLGGVSPASSVTTTPTPGVSPQPHEFVVAGKIVLSLFSDDLGDYGLSMNTKVEEAYLQRLRRLCFMYHRAVLDRVDLLIADVREPYEIPGGASASSDAGSAASSSSSTLTGAVNSHRHALYRAEMPGVSQKLPCFGRTFAEVIERVTADLGPEKQSHTVSVQVEGAKDLIAQGGQMNPFIVVRSDWEQFETPELLATPNPEYSPEAATFQFEVLDHATFRLQVMVLSRISSRPPEEVLIGRSAMTLHSLPMGISFPRALPLVCGEAVSGIARLRLTAFHFGSSSHEMVGVVSQRLKQLTRFLIRYEPAALPLVDATVQRHELVWDSFMSGLIQKYGREPGSVQLGLCINGISCLDWPTAQPAGIQAYVSVRMGDTHLRTSAKRYMGFEELMFNETFVIDVARETDELHVDIVEETSGLSIGRVDLTILGIQRGVTHTRTYTVVAHPGTRDAVCSGRISLSLHSDQVGVDFEVDHESECMFAMRLTRFCERYLPLKLHRVDIAVATTEDMEGFLHQLAQEHGPEPSYVRISVTVEGLRGIGYRYVNSYTQVVLECGLLERHETRVAKLGTQDPEFHETWVMDQPRRDLVLRLKVVAAHGVSSSERVLIATAAIPLSMEKTNDLRWVPLSYILPEDVTASKGTIGVSMFVQPLALSGAETTSSINRSIVSPLRAGGEGSLSPFLGGSSRRHVDPMLVEQTSPIRGGGLSNVSFDTSMISRGHSQLQHRGPASPLTGNPAPTSPFSASRRSAVLTTVHLSVKKIRDLPPFKAGPGQGSTTSEADQHSSIFFVARVLHDVDLMDDCTDDSIVFESARVPLGSGATECSWRIDSPSSLRWSVELPRGVDARRNVPTAVSSDRGDGARYLPTCPFVCLTFYCIPLRTMTCQQLTTTHSPAARVVLSSDPPPKPKKLGDCLVSLAHTPVFPQQWGKEVPLINGAGRPCARPLGVVEVAVSIVADSEQALRGSSFSNNERDATSSDPSVIRPTETAERETRHDLLRFLQARAPVQLHLIDAFLSEYLGREAEMWKWLGSAFGPPLDSTTTGLAQRKPPMLTPADLARGGRERTIPGPVLTSAHHDEETSAVAHITIESVQALMMEGSRQVSLFDAGSIMFKVKTSREKVKTKVYTVPPGSRRVHINETFTLRLAAAKDTTKHTGQLLDEQPQKDEHHLGTFADAADVPVLDEDPNEVHLEVYSCGALLGGRTLLCETFISLLNTQKDVPKQRSHILMAVVKKATSRQAHNDDGNPVPCALCTIVVRNEGGSRTASGEKEERDAQLRLRAFFECYNPQELRRLDLYVGAALHRNQLPTIMARLKEIYGPEPGSNRLEVTVDRCRGTLQTDKSGGHSRPYVVLSLGMSQFQTRSQHALSEEVAFQRETFTFNVGLPDQQELVVHLMDEGSPPPSTSSAAAVTTTTTPPPRRHSSTHEGSTESGRALVSLAHLGRRGVSCTRSLPLIFRAGTKDAVVCGSIELTFFSDSFGRVSSMGPVSPSGSHAPSPSSTSGTTFVEYQHRVLRLLSRYAPEELHRYDVIMGRYIGREEEMMVDLVKSLGAEPGTYPLYVRVIGFRGIHHFTKSATIGTSIGSTTTTTRLALNDLYRDTDDHQIQEGDALVVKVLNNGVMVLKTDTFKVDHGTANLSSSQKNDARTELRDIQESLLTFEIFRRGFFGKKTFIAAVDIGVRHLVREFSNVRWLPLFHVEGRDSDLDGENSNSGVYGGAGHGVAATSAMNHHRQSSFVGVIGVELKTSAFGLPSAKRDDEQMSDVGVDVITLLRKYKPEGLRQADVFLERAPSIAGAHALLRRTFNPAATSTLYVTIHSIQLELHRRSSAATVVGVSPQHITTTAHTGKMLSGTPVMPEPVVWKEGEVSKHVICMGLLAGEMARCEGRCHRTFTSAGKSGGNIRNHDSKPPPTDDAFGALRFDIVPPGRSSTTPEASLSLSSPGACLSLQIMETTSKNYNTTLGSIEISARALLTQPRRLLFGSDEGPLSFPLVLVQQSATAVDAYISGSVTLSVSRPAYEALPSFLSFSPEVCKTISEAKSKSTVPLSSNSTGDSDDSFVVHYYRRILRMLQFYDPAALVTFHRTFFDQEVSGGACSERLPRLLALLKEQWGPEPQV